MRNAKNTLAVLIFANGLLLVALIIALLFGLFADKETPEQPEEEQTAELIDAAPLKAYAADFNVSTEFLQLVLPNYLVYRDGPEYIFQPIDERLPRHDYDWALLEYMDQRIYYPDPRYENTAYGVDVSLYQGEIDWWQVAQDGIDFAILRLGFRGYGEAGTIMIDERFAENIANASAAGLDIGIYFFSQAITSAEAEEEAALVLEHIEGYDITYPVVFDMEEIYGAEARTDKLNPKQTTDIALAFCRKIEQAGFQPMIYGNIKWLAGRLNLADLADYPLWLAQYYKYPLFPYDFRIWQYSNTGRVAGINGDVDLNICFEAY